MKNIFIVEDELLSIEELKNILFKYNYNIVGFGVDNICETTLFESSSATPDLLLVAIELDNKIGIEIAKKLVKTAIPVVVLTSTLQAEIIELTKSVNPYGYILKPYNESVVFATIEVALHRFEIEQDLRKNAAYERLNEKLINSNVEYKEINEKLKEKNEEYETLNEEYEEQNAQLAESEEKYRSLFVNMLDGFVLLTDIYDANGKITDFEVMECNTAAANIFHLSPELTKGLSLKKLYYEGYQKLISHYQKSMLHGKSLRYESYSQLLQKHFHILMYSPRAGLTATVFEDITDRKNAEKELNDTKKFLDTILENSPLPIWISDENGTLIRMNQATRDLLHLIDDNVVGKYNILKDNLVAEQGKMPLVQRVFENGESVQFTLAYDMKQFKQLPLQKSIDLVLDVSISPVLNTEGIVIHAIIQHTDITERIKAEQNIRNSEERFRHISSTISDISYSCIAGNEGDFAINWIMGATERILGYTAEELFALKCWGKLVIKEDFKIFKNNVLDIEPGTSKYCELRLRSKENKIIWIASYAECFHSNDKQYDTILCGGLVDITEKKMIENELKQNKENLQLFFDTINDFLWVLDEKGVIISVNDTVVERLGYTQNELIGMHVLMVHPQERREEAGNIVMQMLQGTAEFCPVPIVTKAGNYIPVETTVSKGSWNGAPAIFGVSKDISALKLSEEKFSKAFHLNKVISGISSVETDKYIEVNDEFCAVLRYTRDEVIGKTSTELGIISAEIRKNIFSKFDLTKGVINIEVTLNDKFGSEVIVLLSAIFIYIQDKKYLYTSALDITALKNNELQLRELNATKDQLLSIIAHDLRSPLSSILGFSDLLEKNLRKYEPEKVERFIDYISTQAKRTLDLLENLLNWAKCQTNQISFDPQNIELSKVVNEILDVLQSAAKIKNITINFCQSEAITIFADLNMLKTILRNLVSNAIKFTNQNGQVDICAIAGEEGIEVTISDNGIGMNEKTSNDLFKLNSPQSTTGTANEKGTGLGLILCKDFVEKHGGKIWVKSVLEQGSTFAFFLPTGN